MPYLTTNAIILRRRDHREADRILTAFAESAGKLEVIARGVRKIESKLAGSLEPLSFVSLTVVPGRTWATVTGSDVLENFPRLRADLRALAAGSVLADLVDHFTRPHAAERRVFALLKEALERLDGAAGTARLDAIRVAATWQLFRLFGFGPTLDRCVSCHRRLPPEEPTFMSARLGGCLGAECRQKDPGVIPSTPATRALLQAAVAEPLNTFVQRPVTAAEFDAVTQAWIESHGTGPLPSLRFAAAVRSA